MANTIASDKWFKDVPKGLQGRLFRIDSPTDTAIALGTGFSSIYAVRRDWTVKAGVTTTAPTIAIVEAAPTVTVTVAANHEVIDHLYVEVLGLP